jgi:hypothetical protein
MTHALQPRPGFDWGRVTWGRPDSPVSALCSYCSAGIGADDMPLRLWREDGSAAQFCDECQARWWGFRRFDFHGEADDGNADA